MIQPITRSQQHNRTLAQLLDVLSSAAAKGEPCPSNYQLLDILNLSTPSHAAELVGKLEKRRAISVTRLSWGRVVTIAATGQSTAATRGTEHGALQRFTSPRDHGAGNIAGSYRGDPPAHLYVERDPCPRCGVRRDIGCVHRADRLVAA